MKIGKFLKNNQFPSLFPRIFILILLIRCILTPISCITTLFPWIPTIHSLHSLNFHSGSRIPTHINCISFFSLLIPRFLTSFSRISLILRLVRCITSSYSHIPLMPTPIPYIPFIPLLDSPFRFL